MQECFYVSRKDVVYTNADERRLNALSEKVLGVDFGVCRPINQSKPLCEVRYGFENMMISMESIEKEPQINADERRFIESDNYENGCKGSEKSCSGVGNPQGFVSDVHRLNALSEEIIGATFEISNVLGAGFLEKVYENALNVELNLRGLKTLPQAPLKVFYKEELVGDYIADILVENEIIIEVKAVK